MFKNKKGEKMHKVEKNIIKVKKFDTFKEAYQYQKTLIGSNFDDGMEKLKIHHKVDTRKNNNFPLMVSDKGDIYYVYSCEQKDAIKPLNILHKMSSTIGISAYDMSRAYIGNDKIVITSKYAIPKENTYRRYCANRGWFVTNISYLQGGI